MNGEIKEKLLADIKEKKQVRQGVRVIGVKVVLESTNIVEVY